MTEVISVNGKTGVVVLTPTDVGALSATSAGEPSGIATLNGSGKLPEGQLPSSVVRGSGMLNAQFPPSGFTAAVGNGVADDTSALQALGQYCYEHGQPLYLPHGRYKTTASLEFTTTEATKWVPGFKIVGDGMGFQKSAGGVYGSVIEPTSAVTGPVISVAGIVNTENSNDGQINGMEFRDFGIRGTTSVGDGIHLKYWTNAVFRNLLIYACTNGVKLMRQANATESYGYGNGTELDMCHLVENRGWGLQMDDAGAIIATINACNFAANKEGGVKMAPGPATVQGTCLFTGNEGPAIKVVEATGGSTTTGPRIFGCHFESNGTVPAGEYTTDEAQIEFEESDTPVLVGNTFLGSTSGQHSVKAGFSSKVSGLYAVGNRHYGKSSVSSQRAFLLGEHVERAALLDKEIFGFGGVSARATSAQAVGGQGSAKGTAGCGVGTVLEGSLSVSHEVLTGVLSNVNLPKGARARFLIATQGGSLYATGLICINSAGSAMVLIPEFASEHMTLSVSGNALQVTQTTSEAQTLLWTAELVGAV